MKQNDIIVIGLAGVAVWLIMQATKARTAQPGARIGGTGLPGTGSSTGTLAGGSTAEIFDNGQGWANGWRYFTDGTAIGPDGAYYLNGQLIWRP